MKKNKDEVVAPKLKSQERIALSLERIADALDALAAQPDRSGVNVKAVVSRSPKGGKEPSTA